MPVKWSSSILTNKCGIFNENSFDHNLQSNYYDVNECKQKVCLFDTNFNIIHLNCRSLPRSFDNIELFFNDLGNPFDCIVLSETWLSDVNADLYVMDGFNLFCCQRISGIGGGLCFYVRNCFDVSILSLQFDCKTFEHFQVTINISKSHKLICSAIYRPPHTSVNDFLDEMSNYRTMIAQLPTIVIILLLETLTLIFYTLNIIIMLNYF